VHAKVELKPDLYLAAYRKIYDLVREFLLSHTAERERVDAWLGAFQKVMFLDMALALDAYFEASTEKIVEANARLQGVADNLEVRNRELAKQYEQAEAAVRIKQEFLSRVSHELRTPLNAIVGYADLLIDEVDGEVNEEQLRSLTRIRIKGQELAGMIERVIDAAKSAATVIDLRPVDAGSIVNRRAVSIEERAAAKGLAVETRVDPGLPPVMADEQELRTALGQLADNALKFTFSGVIRLEAVNLGASVRLTVSDSGPGIPEEHREKVFAPFYQVEFGDTRTTTGLGMGLTIALRAVERMGGTLQLVAAGPEGSSFAVELSAAEGAAYDI
jgi:signal transduction histidine kinase